MIKKGNKITPSIRQVKVAENIVLNAKEHRWETLKDLLLASGYKMSCATQTAKSIIQNKGVQQHLEKIGFNSTAARAVVSEVLLNGEENNRLKAADMVHKSLGLYAPEKKDIRVLNIVELIKELDE